MQLVGPSPSIIEHPSVRVGIGVWGSHLEYPLHEHEAEERHHVLADTRAFGTEDGTWIESVPGDAVHNPTWHRHAQRLGAEPTVLLSCWTGAAEADTVPMEP